MPAQTLAQKLVARAAGRASVAAGEIVTCKVDLALMHDSGGPRRLAPWLAELGAKIRDPGKIVLVIDHYLPAADDDSRAIVRIARDFAREHAIARLYDGQGICHVVLPERGHLRPGLFAVGGDSHAPTGGAFGAYMFGVGATEMLSVVVTGEIWLQVPQTIRFAFDGMLAPGVTAKDVMLLLIGRHGMGGGQYAAIEYTGSAICALPMQERMTLANMTAELGGQTGLIAPDEVTRDYLLAVGVRDEEIDLVHWRSDPEALVAVEHRYDAAQIAPQVAAPGSPANGRSVDEMRGTPINAAYIGACTGAKLVDLRMAAQVLKGRKAAPGLKFWLAPASLRDQEQAAREGTLQVLLEAGARLLPNACGACAGYGQYQFEDSDVVISSTARNFKGRMGSPLSQVYLGSPYTVAASALAGRITDPREVLA